MFESGLTPTPPPRFHKWRSLEEFEIFMALWIALLKEMIEECEHMDIGQVRREGQNKEDKWHT